MKSIPPGGIFACGMNSTLLFFTCSMNLSISASVGFSIGFFAVSNCFGKFDDGCCILKEVGELTLGAAKLYTLKPAIKGIMMRVISRVLLPYSPLNIFCMGLRKSFSFSSDDVMYMNVAISINTM